MPIAPAAEPPVAPSAWSLREPVTALTSERLAVLVQRAATRAGEVLFTATPSEQLDAIGSWQRLMDLAWAGLVRAVREAYDAVDGESAARGSFVADEVAMALGVSVRTGQSVLGEALGVTELPGSCRSGTSVPCSTCSARPTSACTSSSSSSSWPWRGPAGRRRGSCAGW